MGGTPDIFLEHLGSCLLSFIKMPFYHYADGSQLSIDEHLRDKNIEEGRLVTKTPSIDNLDLFFTLFPGSYLIIIIRDGRSVVESGMKSFNWDFKSAVQRWADAAGKLLQFQKSEKGEKRKHLIIKFEELFSDTERELKKIFSFLNLDMDQYNFDASKNLPVYGSSDLRIKKDDRVHWHSAEKTAQFKPLERWHNWDRGMHERFNRIAGKALTEMGYEMKYSDGNILSRFFRSKLI